MPAVAHKMPKRSAEGTQYQVDWTNVYRNSPEFVSVGGSTVQLQQGQDAYFYTGAAALNTFGVAGLDAFVKATSKKPPTKSEEAEEG